MNTINLVNFLFNSNLAWLMHKRYNPKAANRRAIIVQYIARNKHRFDDQAIGAVRNITKCQPWNQMKAYDHWYFLIFGETACENAIQPTEDFIRKTAEKYDAKCASSELG